MNFSEVKTQAIVYLTAIMAERTFVNELGETVSMGFHRDALPNCKTDNERKRRHPFTLVRVLNGREGRNQGQFRLMVMSGIHTSEAMSQVEKSAIIEQVLDDILFLADGSREFTNLALEPEIDWYFGDNQDGNQPDPKYYVTVQFTFSGQPRKTHY